MTLKKIILLFCLLVIVIVAFVFAKEYLKTHSLPFSPMSSVSIDKQTFNVVLAKTEEEQQIGLSETQSLPKNQGMLFLFTTAKDYPFWMKNMKLAIDIIFIMDNKIVKIYQNVPPPSSPTDTLPLYQAGQPINEVLEINAGLSTQYNFKAGDTVTIRY